MSILSVVVVLLFVAVDANKSEKSDSAKCADGSTCSNNRTCCSSSNGGYGCCEIPDAVCCGDGLTCCPSDHTCFMNFCIPKSNVAKPKTRAHSKNSMVPTTKDWPAGTMPCPTPCAAGCCLIPFAVCCSDNIHCCPSGTTCDPPFCISESTLSKISHVIPLKKEEVNKCPSGTTPCPTPSGIGCCPLPSAVCCSDKVHCCPSGTTCDPPFCIRESTLSKISHVIPLKKEEVNKCPSGTTPCPTPSGIGCCPLPSAVCCSDKVHCCPSGTTCDPPFCISESSRFEISHVMPIKRNDPQLTDDCPGGGQCPSGATCCETSKGVAGCCPFPRAVCCLDKVHCCPNGFECDLAQLRCVKGTKYLALVDVMSVIKED